MGSGFAFRECFSEFMGVLTLVYFGGWSVILVVNEKIDLLSVAMVHSITLGLYIWAGGAYSGCHFNPAVTFAFFIGKHIDALKLTFYVVSQFCGSYLAAVMLYYTIPEVLYLTSYDKGAELGSPHMNPEYYSITGFIMEAAGTFVLQFIICCLASQGNAPGYSFVIGFGIAISVFSIGGITGASINPFRYLGPALLSMQLNDSWIYLIAPLFGSARAMILHQKVFELPDSEKAELEAEQLKANETLDQGQEQTAN